MELREVILKNYKKFEKRTVLRIDTFMTAILGANEAGKTSVLDALVHWSNATEFTTGGNRPDVTKGVQIVADQPLVECVFTLDSSDRDELSHIREAKGVITYTEGKLISGKFVRKINPSMPRDVSSRENAAKEIEDLIGSDDKEFDLLFEGLSTGDKNETYTERVHRILSSEACDLEEAELKVLENFLVALKNRIDENSSDAITDFLLKFSDLVEFENKPSANKQIISILSARVPEFLLFDESAKILKDSYDLDDETDRENRAFKNFTSLAGLDVPSLNEFVANQDKASADALIYRANELLKTKFRVWSQGSDSSPRIDREQNLLNIYFGNVNVEQHSLMAESAGLKQFVALMGFVEYSKGESDKETVLMIDEIETHLHYDAQADYIQFLNSTDSSVLKKIIYTTHSSGSLPEDLGLGIKMVVPVDSTKPRSTVANKFWATGSNTGLNPIIFGMGAATLAFLPLRNAVICEGVTDHILLPSIIREVCRADRVGFQVVPGLSELNIEQIPIVDNESCNTIFLLDNDQGGKDKEKSLARAGVSGQRIKLLPSQDTQIESYLDRQVYKKAIEQWLAKNKAVETSFPLSKILFKNRHEAMEKWCHDNGFPSPSKVAVASEIVDLVSDGNTLIAKNKVEILSTFFDEIRGALGVK